MYFSDLFKKISEGNNKLKITEYKEAPSLEKARFSVRFQAPREKGAAVERAYGIISRLFSGHDAIMEVNSGYAGVSTKGKATEVPLEEFIYELKLLGVPYRCRKVPNTAATTLSKLFGGNSRKENDEVMAYIDNELLLSPKFLRVFPSHGVRLFLFRAEQDGAAGRGDAAPGRITAEDKADRHGFISRFIAMTNDEKFTLIDMAVFCYVFLGQVGISTLYMEMDELKKKLLD